MLRCATAKARMKIQYLEPKIPKQMKKTLAVLAGMTLLLVVSLAFTSPDRGPGWKNLKILPQNTTEQQMDSVMEHFSVSLNVGCEFCHVKTINGTTEEWDMASDKKKHKLQAREMMKMTNELNDRYFPYGGKAADLNTALTVTCYSCHNGRKEPLVKPKPAATDSTRKAP